MTAGSDALQGPQNPMVFIAELSAGVVVTLSATVHAVTLTTVLSAKFSALLAAAVSMHPSAEVPLFLLLSVNSIF
jgi:hypothetical protein